MANDTIVLDIDTQWDFVMPDGAWPVPGAFGLTPNFERICRYARMYNLRVVATTQVLSGGDARFQGDGGVPPHALAGSPGQRKVPATRPKEPVVIENRSLAAGDVARMAGAAREIIVETSGPDLMSNPNMGALLDGVTSAFVFGVAGDGAVRTAVQALRARGITVELVENGVALRSTEPDAREKFLDDMKALGAKIVRDLDIMTRFTTARHR